MELFHLIGNSGDEYVQSHLHHTFQGYHQTKKLHDMGITCIRWFLANLARYHHRCVQCTKYVYR